MSEYYEDYNNDNSQEFDQMNDVNDIELESSDIDSNDDPDVIKYLTNQNSDDYDSDVIKYLGYQPQIVIVNNYPEESLQLKIFTHELVSTLINKTKENPDYFEILVKFYRSFKFYNSYLRKCVS